MGPTRQREDEHRQATARAVQVPVWVGWILVVCGVIGTAASFILTQDKINILSVPGYTPGCDLSSTISCSQVMKSWQASLFGPVNSLMGLAAFPALAAVGAYSIGRAATPRLLWWIVQIGSLAGIIFAHWLMVQSLFVLRELCLYCMTVWVVTIVSFCYITFVTLANDPAKLDTAQSDSDEIELPAPRLPRWHAIVPVVWLAVVAALMLIQFG